MISIVERLRRLENRPQSQIPRFIIEYEDGSTEHFIGADIISHVDSVRRLYYNPQHQASFDAAALYALLHEDVEVLPQ